MVIPAKTLRAARRAAAAFLVLAAVPAARPPR